MTTKARLLVVDDEQHVRTSLACWFREEGYEVDVAAGGKEALATIARTPVDILLVDIKMPGMDGLELQRRARELAPDATVIIMTAYAAVETAVQAMKEGAYDYIVKPFDPEELSRLVRKAAERYTLLTQNRALRERLEAAAPVLITAGTGAMGEVLALIDQVGPTETSVLITGESGTGKELVARLLHSRSNRKFGAFVPVNCGALAEGVLESELFGHEKGAFTGAVSRRHGKLELASEGTLFLDEIGDVPPKVQVDLLRVLQERTIVRVGGNASLNVDFRLVTATHRDLEAEVGAGRFREDFFYRINVFRIQLSGPARPSRGHPPAGGALPAQVHLPDEPAHRGLLRRRDGRADGLPVAGQRPRAAERHREVGGAVPGERRWRTTTSPSRARRRSGTTPWPPWRNGTSAGCWRRAATTSPAPRRPSASTA